MLPFKIGHYHMMGGCQMHCFSLSLCYSSSDAFYKCSNSKWRLLSQIHPKFILVLGWSNQNQWGHFHLCKSKMVTGDSLWIGVLDLLGQLNHQVLAHFLPVSNWTPKPRFVPNISHCRKYFKLNYFLYVVVLHDCFMLCSLYSQNSMPAAAGAVTAAAVADQMLGPKEDRHLAIVLVCICISYWSELAIIFIILLLSLSVQL